jgi:predicted cupin superfamily sugar epimerase
MVTADEVIRLFDLKPQAQEGGFFRETYRAADRLPSGQHISTAIYYLLTPQTFSAMHRLPTDEIFHFYAGSPVTMLHLGPDGGRVVTLGSALEQGQQPQLIVPRGVWQGSFLPAGAFALLGTTMAPGFDCSDYEAGDRAQLAAQYPAYADLIRRLTRDG